MKLNAVELAMGRQALAALRRAEDKLYREQRIAELWYETNVKNVDPDKMIDMAINGEPFPAACVVECLIEPDGVCEHGHPSVLKILGLM